MNDEIWKPRILHPFQTYRHHIDTHEKRRRERFINIILSYLSFQLSEDIGYVLYSALGSFYIPSCIMVFVYIRIYYAAKARARRGIRKQPRKPPNEQVSENNSRSRLPKTLSRQNIVETKTKSQGFLVGGDVEGRVEGWILNFWCSLLWKIVKTGSMRRWAVEFESEILFSHPSMVVML